MSSKKMRIAHISDVHVWEPETVVSGSELMSFKRWQGFINLKLTRGQNTYPPSVLRAALNDMIACGVDHLVVTGDVTNISLESEFSDARKYFQEFVDAKNGQQQQPKPVMDWLTVIPGNHDAYTSDSVAKDLFGKYFGDTLPFHSHLFDNNPTEPLTFHDRFPALKVLEDPNANSRIVLICFNTGVPTRLFTSSGVIGEPQLQRAYKLLQPYLPNKSANNAAEATNSSASDQQHNTTIIALLHHPPIDRDSSALVEYMTRLTDRDDFLRFCRECSIDMVLNGHTHKPYIGFLPAANENSSSLLPENRALLIDPGSGTYVNLKEPQLMARYNVYEFVESRLVSATSRIWQPASRQFVDVELQIPGK